MRRAHAILPWALLSIACGDRSPPAMWPEPPPPTLAVPIGVDDPEGPRGGGPVAATPTPEPAKPEPAAAEPAKPEPAAAEPAKPEKAAAPPPK